jgi:hypothetical protein
LSWICHDSIEEDGTDGGFLICIAADSTRSLPF